MRLDISVVNKARRHKAKANATGRKAKAKTEAPSHKADDWTYMDSTQTDKSSQKARLALLLLTVHVSMCVNIKSISQISQLLHLRKTSISSRLSIMRERCGLTSNPFWEKTHSTCAEVDRREESRSSSLRRSLYWDIFISCISGVSSASNSASWCVVGSCLSGVKASMAASYAASVPTSSDE